jgi:hypothetical protein
VSKTSSLHGARVLTMDSAVLGLASPVIVDVKGTVFGFEQNIEFKADVRSHDVVCRYQCAIVSSWLLCCIQG